MKFTAQEEYGLRCVLNLARAHSDETRDSSFMTVGAIAETEGLSVQYVGKLFRILAKAEYQVQEYLRTKGLLDDPQL